MATRKTTQSSIDPHELTKSTSIWDVVNSDTTLLYNPSKEEWRKKLCYTILKWANQDTSTNIKSFCAEWNIPYYLIQEWLQKYPDLKRVWNEAKLRIGIRRQDRAEVKQMDASLVRLSLHTYDQEWLDINQYHADLKNQEGESQAAVNIYLGKPEVLSSEELLLEVNQTQEH